MGTKVPQINWQTANSIRISPETKQRLDAIGSKNETYESLIKRLLDHYDKIQELAAPANLRK